MRKSRFLCLAVSRRDGGYCLAGIDLDSNEWIRPVSPKTRGALGFLDIYVHDVRSRESRTLRPLDVVTLYLGDFAGSEGQPENWTLLPAPDGNSPVVSQCLTDDPALIPIIRRLADASELSRDLLGTMDNKVDHQSIKRQPKAESLCIVRPRELVWMRTLSANGKPRIEGRFRFGTANCTYRIPMTDIYWEQKLLQATLDKSTVSWPELRKATPDKDMLLTVSLGENFKLTGLHYKLIAGVLLIPAR